MNRDSGSRKKSNGPDGIGPLLLALVWCRASRYHPGTRRQVVSVRMMAKVWELDLSQPLKLLALALADTGNDDGENIWPSKAYLAWKVCASPRTVQRQLADLERRGIVTVEAERGHQLPSGQWTRLLKLHPDRGVKLSPLKHQGETPATQRGDTGDQKGRHGYVSLSVSDPLDNHNDFSNEEPRFPKLPGESRKDWVRRFTAQMGRLDR